jgi:flavodoxin
LKTLMVCQSTHHGNTMRVAQAMAEELGAEIRKPSEVTARGLDGYDLVGFGSGIYNRKHDASLFKLVESLESPGSGRCFVFSTASTCYTKPHQALKAALAARGFDVLDEFVCRGFMDYSFTKYLGGGINKDRPNESDLAAARAFASKLKQTC